MIGSQTRTQVRERAHNACEYCHLHQDDSPLAALHVEHVIPKAHGETDELDNLALACIDCNLYKGTNLTGIDPQTKVTEAPSSSTSKLERAFRLAESLYSWQDSHGPDYDPSA